jgi:tetratricopeptide (TPR) repeat protein
LKKYDFALADFNVAIKEDPKFVLAFISRADTYLSMGDDEKALADLEEALSLDPKQARAYFLRARYYKHKNKNDLALKDFNTAVSIDASFLDKEYGPQSQAEKDLLDHFAKSLKLGKKKEVSAQLIERGMAHERSGEYMEAIREFTDAISDSPDSLEAYKWRASVYLHMSAFQNAIDDLNKAIEISPNDPNLRAERAKAHLENGQAEKAIADYSKAIELSTSPPANLFEARGLVYSREGKSQEAVLDFGKSIELDPAGSTAYADRGLEYVVHKRYQDAIADFNESIKNGHDLAVCYKFRGQCKHYLGDQKGSIDDLEKAAQLYKNKNDLFGCKQIEKLIAEFKKDNSTANTPPPAKQASKN